MRTNKPNLFTSLQAFSMYAEHVASISRVLLNYLSLAQIDDTRLTTTSVASCLSSEKIARLQKSTHLLLIIVFIAVTLTLNRRKRLETRDFLFLNVQIGLHQREIVFSKLFLIERDRKEG